MKLPLWINTKISQASLVYLSLFQKPDRIRRSDWSNRRLVSFPVRSISMNCFVVKPALNHSNQQLNYWTGQTVRFFTNRPYLNCYKYFLLLRGPLSIRPIPRPILLKLKLIISPYLVQTTRPKPITRNVIKLIFRSCLQV